MLTGFVVMLPSSTYGVESETSRPVPCLGPVQLTCEDARNLDTYVVKLEAELTAAKVPPPPKDCASSSYPLVAGISVVAGVLLGVITAALVVR